MLREKREEVEVEKEEGLTEQSEKRSSRQFVFFCFSLSASIELVNCLSHTAGTVESAKFQAW